MSEVTIQLPLTRGKYTVIDLQDLDLVMKHGPWFADPTHTDGRFYAKANTHTDRGRGRVGLHRLILGVTDTKIQVDHINGDSLDNRRVNLRVVSASENAKNRRTKKSKKGNKGVYLDRKTGRYYAAICCNYKQHYLGRYKTEQEAVAAYNLAAIRLFGSFASLNKMEIDT